MSEEEIVQYKQIQNTANDYVASGLKAALGMVPFAGSLLAEIAGAVIPQQRIDRIADFAQRLEYRISHLENEIVRSGIDDEEFTDLVEESLRQAARSTTEERREYLASLVAKSLSRETVEYSGARHILRLLGELSGIEVIWLRFFDNPMMGGDKDFRELHKAVLEPVFVHMDSGQEELDKASLQKNYKTHLERLGLIAGKVRTDRDQKPEFDRANGEFKRDLYQTTNLGRLLLRSIDLTSDFMPNVAN